MGKKLTPKRERILAELRNSRDWLASL